MIQNSRIGWQVRNRNRMFIVYGWGNDGQFCGLSITVTSKEIADKLKESLPKTP